MEGEQLGVGDDGTGRSFCVVCKPKSGECGPWMMKLEPWAFSRSTRMSDPNNPREDWQQQAGLAKHGRRHFTACHSPPTTRIPALHTPNGSAASPSSSSARRDRLGGAESD